LRIAGPSLGPRLRGAGSLARWGRRLP